MQMIFFLIKTNTIFELSMLSNKIPPKKQLIDHTNDVSVYFWHIEMILRGIAYFLRIS